MTGREGFSSDDLLRQAREAIERRDLTADDAEATPVPTGTPPPPEPERALPPPYEPFEATPPPPRAERAPRSDDRMERPTDRIATADTPSVSRRPGIAVGVLLAVLGVGVAIFFAGLLDDSTAVEDVGVGTCLNDPGGEIVTDVDPVSCDEPHEFEMIGSVEIPGDGFPGDETFDLAVDRCIPMFEDYVGIAYEDSIWWLNAFTPTEEGWEQGDRIANCLVFQFDADRNILPVTGSARGDGR